LAQVLRRVHGSEPTLHPDLLVGITGSDDAGVFRISDDLALVQTADFFTPIVDDPADWGRIAAANALSDVYAMGGIPLTALQLLSWPRDGLPWDTAADVIDGGLEILATAGCALVGGHSIDDPEPKYGFAITGTVHPDRIITNTGARPGDLLVLTKPIGTGIITTAVKAGAAGEVVRAAAVATMIRLNAAASAAAIEIGVNAGTDVTGFGLLGHLSEMLRGGAISADIEFHRIPVLDGAADLVAAGHVPGGSKRNRTSVAADTDFGDLGEISRILVTDAQTSGGLLLAVSPDRVDDLVDRLTSGGDRAAVIGRIVPTSGDDPLMRVVS
jgi:selenide,water dikinase